MSSRLYCNPWKSILLPKLFIQLHHRQIIYTHIKSVIWILDHCSTQQSKCKKTQISVIGTHTKLIPLTLKQILTLPAMDYSNPTKSYDCPICEVQLGRKILRKEHQADKPSSFSFKPEHDTLPDQFTCNHCFSIFTMDFVLFAHFRRAAYPNYCVIGSRKIILHLWPNQMSRCRLRYLRLLRCQNFIRWSLWELVLIQYILLSKWKSSNHPEPVDVEFDASKCFLCCSRSFGFLPSDCVSEHCRLGKWSPHA